MAAQVATVAAVFERLFVYRRFSLGRQIGHRQILTTKDMTTGTFSIQVYLLSSIQQLGGGKSYD